MANTGYKHYTTRKEYLVDPSTGAINYATPTGLEEANTTGDDYVADVLSYASCPVVTSFLMSYIPTNTTPSAACSDQSAGVYYHDGAGSLPTNGDYIYTETSGTTVFAGNSKYYKNLDDPGGASMYIDNSGLVSQYSSC